MEGLREVVNFVKDNNDFVIVSHYDADGITSAAIAGLMLKRLKKKFKIHITKSLDVSRIAEIRKLGNNFLFMDLGSGSIEELEKGLKGKKFAVTDHHTPQKKGNVPHFNAHYAGLDGSNEISGAGIIYLVAKELDEKNIDLAKIAVVGAVGDMQDYATGKLIGYNTKILEDAIKNKDIEVKKDIKLFGRHSRPLIQFLVYCTDPFLPGLTANEEASSRFITDLGLSLKKDDNWLYYCDLNDDEKKRLISAIYVYAKQSNIPEFILKGLIGEVYELTKEPERTELRDVKEFSTMLNACGRNDNAMIGVKVCMGDRKDNLKKARTLLQEHRQNLRKGIELVQQKGVAEMKNIYVMDTGKEIKDTIIGVIAGMLYGANTIKQDKPVIAVSIDDEDKLKISGRANSSLVRRGIHLGNAMKELSEIIGGAGGGHNVAAGARIEIKDKKEFLEKLDEIIGEQLAEKNKK